MSDRLMIEISIRESRVNGVESTSTEILVATVPPKLAAATLRAYADELDPKQPVMRLRGSDDTGRSGGV